jgi:APA family basic amino acid/polyamine antiporter
LISYVVFTDWIFFALAAAGVFIFRKRSHEGSYKTLGYPLTPLFFIATSVWFIVNTLVERPAQAWAGLGFLALGVPVYYFWRKRKIAPA